MQADNRNELIELLILALISLTSWKEKCCDVKTAWRSYDWASIGSLQDQALALFSRSGKSSLLLMRARSLAQRLRRY